MSKFLKFIVNLFLTVAILTAAAILVPPVLGVNTTIVDSAGMDTNLPLGSVTYSVDVPVTKLSAGDEILKESGSSTYAYIIEEGDAATGKYKVSSAVDRDSQSEITLRNTVSLVKVSIPYIGYVVVAMQTVEGIIIIVLVVLFIIILFVLSELWKSRDDDDDDDDDDDSDGDSDSPDDQYEELAEGFDGEAAAQEDFAEVPQNEGSGDAENLEFEEIPVQSEFFGDEGYPDNAEGEAQAQGDASFYAEPVNDGYNSRNTDTSGSYEAVNTGAAGAIIPEREMPQEQVDKFGTWNTTDMGFAMELERGLALESGADGAASEEQPAYDNPAGEFVQTSYEQPVYSENAADQPVYQQPVMPQVEEQIPQAAAETAFAEVPAATEMTAAAYDTGSDYEEHADIELEPNQFIAARRLSLEEILEQARKRGGEPKISRDDVSGVDIVDYSDLIVK